MAVIDEFSFLSFIAKGKYYPLPCATDTTSFPQESPFLWNKN